MWVIRRRSSAKITCASPRSERLLVVGDGASMVITTRPEVTRYWSDAPAYSDTSR
jgi:hypothetical protein